MFTTQLLVWSFIVYGITQIIVEAKIFAPLRDWFNYNRFGFFRWFGSLLSCFLCTSVWVSFILSASLYSPTLELWSNLLSTNVLNLGVNTFLDGMLGSCIVWFMYCIESKLSK